MCSVWLSLRQWFAHFLGKANRYMWHCLSGGATCPGLSARAPRWRGARTPNFQRPISSTHQRPRPSPLIVRTDPPARIASPAQVQREPRQLSTDSIARVSPAPAHRRHPGREPPASPGHPSFTASQALKDRQMHALRRERSPLWPWPRTDLLLLGEGMREERRREV